MTFDEYVDKQFQINLELAQEDLCAVNDYDGYSLRQAWSMAVEWTMNDIENEIGQRFENKWQEQQEALNKRFYK